MELAQGISLLETAQGSEPLVSGKLQHKLTAAVGFKMKAARAGHSNGIGESASVGSASTSPEQDQTNGEIGDLEDEIQALQTKVRAAEKRGVDEKDFLQKQSNMQKEMLEQKLAARLKSKQLELDGQVGANKRKMTHELQQADLQAAAQERAEESVIENMKIKVADESSKAQRLMQEAQAEKEAAAAKAQQQETDLGAMRAQADAMEAELEEADMAKINDKAKIENLETAVAHVEKESAKMNAAADMEDKQKATAEASAEDEQAKLKEALVEESKMESDAKASQTQAEVLSVKLAKETAQGTGAEAEKAQLTKLSGELLAEEAKNHQAKYKEASEKEAFEAAATRSEHELDEMNAKKKALEQEEAALRAKDVAERKQVERESQDERAALKQDNKAEDAELLREMKAEAASDKAERESLKRKLNATNTEAADQQGAAKLELEKKKGDDAIKRREALQQVEHASVSAAAAQIKSEYKAAMERVNTLKMEDEEVQQRSKQTIARINAQLVQDKEAMVNVSVRAIASIERAAETKVTALFKAMGIEKKEELAEEEKAGAATGEATAREKSAIQRAVSGEQGAIADAIKEAVTFAESKAAEAASKEQEMMTELTNVIAKAAEANTAEAAEIGKINEEKKSAQNQLKKEEIELDGIKKELNERSKALQETHATLASTSVKVRSNGDTIVKLQSDVDKVESANKMLQAQIKDKKDQFADMATKLHNKIKLRDALKGQFAMVQEQLSAANKTEVSLKKVKEVKEEEANSEASANAADNKGTEAALKLLKEKEAKLKQDTAAEEAAAKKAGTESKSSLWSTMLGM